MAKTLSSKAFLELKYEQLRKKCSDLLSRQIVPRMNVILVGDNPGSISYVKNKELLCQKVGAHCDVIKLPSNVTPAIFLTYIEKINADPQIHGAIIQLPLPTQLQCLKIKELIIPIKDIDGFHPQNAMDLYFGELKPESLIPCTPAGIMFFLNEHLHYKLEGALVCLIGRSNIVGKPMLHLLNQAGATVVWCHSKTKNLSVLTKSADLVISATGQRKFLNASHFHAENQQLIIDVGITGGKNESLAGDLDVESIKDFPNLSYTPVPGGVGPLTIYKLIDNLLLTAKMQTEQSSI